jgi:hypothetical protein
MYRTYVAALLISLPEMHAARLGRERGRLGQLLTALYIRCAATTPGFAFRFCALF